MAFDRDRVRKKKTVWGFYGLRVEQVVDRGVLRSSGAEDRRWGEVTRYLDPEDRIIILHLRVNPLIFEEVATPFSPSSVRTSTHSSGPTSKIGEILRTSGPKIEDCRWRGFFTRVGPALDPRWTRVGPALDPRWIRGLTAGRNALSVLGC